MPVKTQYVTADVIRQAVLPSHGKTYTVIPHSYLIDETKKYLQDAGMGIKQELYKVSQDGQIAQGIYHLANHTSDPDTGMMFAWSNSYNKTMSFKCAVGAHVFVCMNGMVKGDMASYKRRHTGSALHDASESIKAQLKDAGFYYNNLVADKELFKTIVLSKKDQSSLLGQLFIEKEIITLYQMGTVKKEMESPSYHYNAHPDSLWSLYNHITLALKDSHPTSFLDDHHNLHNFFVDQFGHLQTTAPHLERIELLPETEAVLQDTESIFGVNFL